MNNPDFMQVVKALIERGNDPFLQIPETEFLSLQRPVSIKRNNLNGMVPVFTNIKNLRAVKLFYYIDCNLIY